MTVMESEWVFLCQATTEGWMLWHFVFLGTCQREGGKRQLLFPRFLNLIIYIFFYIGLKKYFQVT